MGKHVHEKTDVDVRAIVIFTIGLLVFIAVSIVAVIFFFRILAHQEGQGMSPASMSRIQLPSGPTLQVTPRRDRIEILNDEKNILNTVGWVDRDKGIVHIPIEKAMKLMLEKGYSVREN